MNGKNVLKKALGLFILTLVMVPVMKAYALGDYIEYKVYDSNSNYEFSCMVMDSDYFIDDHVDYSIRSCIANNKGITANRVTINKNGNDIFYHIAYGSGTIKWDGDINIEWYDDESSIYFIKNDNELAGLAYLVNTGNTFEGKTIKLVSNMDISKYNWVPIGKDEDYPFKGFFDGQGYTISGLNFSLTSEDMYNYALFGYTSEAIIKNLNVTNVNFNLLIENDRENYISAVVANSVRSTLTNIKSSGDIRLVGRNGGTGGIVGRSSSSTLSLLQSQVNIHAYILNIGGIVGSSVNSNISNCINFGDLHSSFDSSRNYVRVSGIVSAVDGGIISESINYGNISSDFEGILSSIVGYYAYNGGSTNNVYSQDNINVLEGEEQIKGTEINEDNINEILNILNENGDWQIVDGKIVHIFNDIKPYTVNISNSDNGKIYYSGKEDNVIVLSVLPNKGYEIDVIEVYDNNNLKIELNGYEFIMPESDVTIYATFKPIEYQFISGENAIYQDSDLVFSLDGEYDLVDKVLINNEELDSSNYTIVEGSTVLTLKNEYLKTLNAGIYELNVAYANGSSDTTTFTILEQDITTPTDDNQDSNTGIVDNPQTYDDVLFHVGLGLLSIIGVIGSGIYLKRYA